MFKKKNLPLSSTELKETAYLLNVFCAFMAVLILGATVINWIGLVIIESRLSTITSMIVANKQLN